MALFINIVQAATMRSFKPWQALSLRASIYKALDKMSVQPLSEFQARYTTIIHKHRLDTNALAIPTI